MQSSSHSSSSPLVQTVLLVILTFGLALCALLTYLNTAPNAAPLPDRFINAKHNQPDPFRLPGCIHLVGVASGPAACDPQSAKNLATLLPDAQDLRTKLHQYAAPRRGHSPNTITVMHPSGGETQLIQGRSLELALSPPVAEKAQTTVACYTGDKNACQKCDWCDTTQASAMYEGARARAMGVVVVDVQTGNIEAAASATSPCFIHQHKAFLDAKSGCPLLPNERIAHADKLENQALYGVAKPGSMVKLIIAMGLQKSGLSAAEAASLPAILTHSQSPELIDLVMCKAQKFDATCAKRRLQAVAEMAVAVGWNQKTDPLSAGQLPELSVAAPGGRLLRNENGNSLITPRLALNSEALQACSQNKWGGCKGAELVNIVAELFGTGDAQATPLAVGSVLLHLATAANNTPRTPSAHLVSTAHNDQGRMHPAMQEMRPPAISARLAPTLVAGLSRTATEGTAKTACQAAAGVKTGLLPCAALPPGIAPMRIAAKTGTPVMSADVGKTASLTLPQWVAQCQALRTHLRAETPQTAHWHHLLNQVLKCNMVPTKWFAFMVSPPGSTTWDKVVVVMAERNWNHRTGLIDTPNDRGSNVAAEAGLALANALYQGH